MLPPPPAVAAERADAVFEARVDGVANDPSGPGAVRYELAVLRVFKGDVPASAQLTTRSSSVACGRSFTIGKRYLIYAGRTDDGELTDSSCSRTRLSVNADEDLAVLGAGAPPMSAPATDMQSREPPRIEPPPLPDRPKAARRGCEIGGLGGAAGLWVIAALGLRRRRV